MKVKSKNMQKYRMTRESIEIMQVVPGLKCYLGRKAHRSKEKKTGWNFPPSENLFSFDILCALLLYILDILNRMV